MANPIHVHVILPKEVEGGEKQYRVQVECGGRLYEVADKDISKEVTEYYLKNIEGKNLSKHDYNKALATLNWKIQWDRPYEGELARIDALKKPLIQRIIDTQTQINDYIRLKKSVQKMANKTRISRAKIRDKKRRLKAGEKYPERDQDLLADYKNAEMAVLNAFKEKLGIDDPNRVILQPDEIEQLSPEEQDVYNEIRLKREFHEMTENLFRQMDRVIQKRMHLNEKRGEKKKDPLMRRIRGAKLWWQDEIHRVGTFGNEKNRLAFNKRYQREIVKLNQMEKSVDQSLMNAYTLDDFRKKAHIYHKQDLIGQPLSGQQLSYLTREEQGVYFNLLNAYNELNELVQDLELVSRLKLPDDEAEDFKKLKNSIIDLRKRANHLKYSFVHENLREFRAIRGSLPQEEINSLKNSYAQQHENKFFNEEQMIENFLSETASEFSRNLFYGYRGVMDSQELFQFLNKVYVEAKTERNQRKVIVFVEDWLEDLFIHEQDFSNYRVKDELEKLIHLIETKHPGRADRMKTLLGQGITLFAPIPAPAIGPYFKEAIKKKESSPEKAQAFVRDLQTFGRDANRRLMTHDIIAPKLPKFYTEKVRKTYDYFKSEFERFADVKSVEEETRHKRRMLMFLIDVIGQCHKNGDQFSLVILKELMEKPPLSDELEENDSLKNAYEKATEFNPDYKTTIPSAQIAHSRVQSFANLPARNREGHINVGKMNALGPLIREFESAKS